MERAGGYMPGAALEKYRNRGSRRYSVWVYDNDEIITVHPERLPNTREVWFEFNEFSRMYWKKFEDECITEERGSAFYNFALTRRFMMEYMLARTNFPGLEEIEHREDGRATDDAIRRMDRVHPRIWAALFRKVEMFPEGLPDEDEAEMEKQAKTLFCDHKGVNSPHEWIELYCNLTSFWEKFGLNYNDVMNLPNDLYLALRKVMALDSRYTEMSFERDRARASGGAAPRAPRAPHGRRR